MRRCLTAILLAMALTVGLDAQDIHRCQREENTAILGSERPQAIPDRSVLRLYLITACPHWPTIRKWPKLEYFNSAGWHCPE